MDIIEKILVGEVTKQELELFILSVVKDIAERKLFTPEEQEVIVNDYFKKFKQSYVINVTYHEDFPTTGNISAIISPTFCLN